MLRLQFYRYVFRDSFYIHHRRRRHYIRWNHRFRLFLIFRLTKKNQSYLNQDWDFSVDLNKIYLICQFKIIMGAEQVLLRFGFIDQYLRHLKKQPIKTDNNSILISSFQKIKIIIMNFFFLHIWINPEFVWWLYLIKYKISNY